MRINLTLQQLEAFVELAKTSNFRAAAQALHVSQPALSRTVKLMEDVIGARLFDRDTRHVEITPTGVALLPIATRILENFNNSFSELSQFLRTCDSRCPALRGCFTFAGCHGRVSQTIPAGSVLFARGICRICSCSCGRGAGRFRHQCPAR